MIFITLVKCHCAQFKYSHAIYNYIAMPLTLVIIQFILILFLSLVGESHFHHIALSYTHSQSYISTIIDKDHRSKCF